MNEIHGDTLRGNMFFFFGARFVHIYIANIFTGDFHQYLQPITTEFFAALTAGAIYSFVNCAVKKLR